MAVQTLGAWREARSVAVTYLGNSYLDLHGYRPMQMDYGRRTIAPTPFLANSSTTSRNASPISDNSLPGGSVTYIANNTGPGLDTFAALFASCIRNQWTLMAYSIPRQSGKQLSLALQFFGTGPERLFVRLTAVSALPASALIVGLVVILRAFILTTSIVRRYWVNRIL
jgi:hypothetical protein